jgi:glycosyltransferase involved in cell wall biosynthesis
MMSPIRLTAVLTHPVQYYAPWFRSIEAHCAEIALTVLYATRPTAEQQGVGFATSFEWDVPVIEGYRCRVVRSSRPGESVHSDRFWGLDVPEIGSAIRESGPDVVLVPGWHSVTLLRALLTCRLLGIPLIYRGDTNLGTAAAGWRRIPWKLRTWGLLRLFGGYLSVGQRAYEYLQYSGVSDARIWHAPHCVDNELFAHAAAPYQTREGRAAARATWGLGPDEFVVLFVGKLEAKKRPLDLIRAVACMELRPRLLMIGAGPMEAECRTEAARLGVSVAWGGFVNQLELGRAYGVADCLTLPSDWGESWGLVVNEALASGVPCVASDRVGCVPDLITPGVTGEVFPAGDVQELATALTRLRSRLRVGQEWSAACRARVAAYSFSAATAGLVAACRAVTRRSAVGGRVAGRPRDIT